MPRWRLGVALLIPEPIATEINGLRRALGDGGLERIPPHITLVPPVNVRVDDIPRALSVLRRAAAKTKPFTLELGPVDTFAPVSPVIKLAVDSEEVQELRDAVFVPPLERRLTFPFVPHVTLADGADDPQLAEAPRTLRAYQTTVNFDRVHLLREEEGRVWEPIADYRFAPAIVVSRGGLPLELSVSSLVDPQAAALLPDEELRSDLALVARRSGEAVGFIAGQRDGSALEVTALYVAEDVRRQGIGTHLVRGLQHAAEQDGVWELHADDEQPFYEFIKSLGAL